MGPNRLPRKGTTVIDNLRALWKACKADLRTFRKTWITSPRSLQIVCQLLVVVTVLWIGYRSFGSPRFETVTPTAIASSIVQPVTINVTVHVQGATVTPGQVDAIATQVVESVRGTLEAPAPSPAPRPLASASPTDDTNN